MKKNTVKNNFIRILLLALTGVTLLLSCIFSSVSFKKLDSSAYTNGGAAIGNIYNPSTGTFNPINLNQLAQKAGYSSFVDMANDAKNGNTKNSNDFGSATVKFGVSASEEFEFLPVYLSKSSDGDPILTLYLATSGGATAHWGNGTWSSISTLPSSAYGQYGVLNHTVTGAPVRSSTYDISALRVRTLLGLDESVVNWKNYNSAPPAPQSMPNVSIYNKYAPFRSGGTFSEYLVTPSKMAWQMAETEHNDPASNDNTFPTTWVGDNLWIPSNGEVTGNLWRLSQTKRADSIETYLRTQGGSYNDHTYYLTTGGTTATDNMDTPWRSFGVRFAIHLNLSKLNVVSPPAVKGNLVYDIDTHTIDFTDSAQVADFDLNKMEITGVTYDGTLPAGYTQPAFTDSSVTYTEAGKYKVSLKAKPIVAGDPETWLFGDTGTDTTVIEFTVKKKKLTVPNFGLGSANTKNYEGTDLTFTASNYVHVGMTATPAYPRAPLTYAITRQLPSGGSYAAYSPKQETATADGKLELILRDAGNYKTTFTIADGVNYEWADGTGTAKDATFVVKPKQLTVSDNGASGWSWAADAVSEARTVTVSGLFTGGGSYSADVVNLQLQISDSSGTNSVLLNGTNNGDGSYTFTIDKDVSIFGGAYAVGTYWVKPVLGAGTSGPQDGNYSLDTALGVLNGGNGYKMVISAAGAGLSSYALVYSSDDGDAGVTMPAAGVPFKYKAGTTTAAKYTVELSTTNFAAPNDYLQIVTSYNDEGFVNGYKGNEASAAGTYTGYVRLRSTDPSRKFNGTDAEANVSFTYTITKADYDYTNVKWQYTNTKGEIQDYPATWDATNGTWTYTNLESGADAGIPWYGENYTFTLAGLPAGVTITNPTSAYTGNKNKFIGSYTAECLGISYDASNFNALPSGITQFTYRISQAVVTITNTSWTTEAAGSGNTFYVPTLQSVEGIEYEYWDLDASPAVKLGSIADVTVTSGSVKNYCVVAVVKSGTSKDGMTLWSDAIRIEDTSNAPVEINGVQTSCAKTFQTGDNKTPVQITLGGSPYTYDGKAHGILDDGTNDGELSIQVAGNNFPVTNYTITYYKKDTNFSSTHNIDTSAPLSGAPKDAGEYVIVIQLTATAEADYFVTAQYVEFTIEPYAFDMSQVKWGYVDGEGNEIEYNPSMPPQYRLDETGNAVDYELVLIGLPRGDGSTEATAEEQLLAAMFAESKLGDEAADGGLLTYSGDYKKSEVNGVRI